MARAARLRRRGAAGALGRRAAPDHVGQPRGRARRGVRRVSRRTRRRPRVHRRRDRTRRAGRALGGRGLDAGTRSTRCRTCRSRTCADGSAPIADFICGSPSESLWMVGVTGTNGKTSCVAVDRAGARSGRASRGRRSARSATASRARSRPRRTPRPTPRCCRRRSRVSSRPARRWWRWRCRRIGLDQGRVNGTPLRRGAVHQPDARPSRLPRHDGRLRRGEGEAVRLAGTRGRGGQHRRRRSASASRGLARARGARVLCYGVERRRHHRDRHRDDGRRHGALGGDAVGQRQPRDARRRHVQRLEPARHARRPARERRAARATRSTRWRRLEPPPGRMQRLGGGSAPLVVIDYAHTPDALEKVLAALGPRSAPGARWCACSAAVATATPASAARWDGSRRRSRTASS